jgi:hypothetical protein
MAEMDEPRQIGDRLRSFEDLARADNEVLRQVATRVHIIDLAYAFGTADEALRDRLLASVRPNLADEIRAAIRTVESSDAMLPAPEQVATARARVMEVARGEVSPADG